MLDSHAPYVRQLAVEPILQEHFRWCVRIRWQSNDSRRPVRRLLHYVSILEFWREKNQDKPSLFIELALINTSDEYSHFSRCGKSS